MILTRTKEDGHHHTDVISFDISRLPGWLTSGALIFISVLAVILMNRVEAFKCPNGAVLARSCDTIPIDESLQYIETQVDERLQSISMRLDQEFSEAETALNELRTSLISIHISLESLIDTETDKEFYTIYYEYNKLILGSVLGVQYDIKAIKEILNE